MAKQLLPWLVFSTYPSEKYELVSSDYAQDMEKMFQDTDQVITCHWGKSTYQSFGAINHGGDRRGYHWMRVDEGLLRHKLFM